MIGCICELHTLCIPGNRFPDLGQGLAKKLLNETPRVLSHMCYIIQNLVMATATAGINLPSHKF